MEDNFQYTPLRYTIMRNPYIIDIDTLIKAKDNIGNKIKHLRYINQLNQETLAYDLSIPRTTLSEYEHGKKTPTLDNIIKIALYFRVSCDYLIGTQDILDNDYKKNPDAYILLIDFRPKIELLFNH